MELSQSRIRLYTILFLALVGLVFAASNSQAEEDSRVIAIGDVHGDYTAFHNLLQEIAVIDQHGDWIAGRTQLVSLGDLLDRGPDSRKVMDLLRTLEASASQHGGRVHVLLGNHELMNLTGDLRDVSAEEFAAFGGREKHTQAFNLDGEYGAWLMSKPTALVIDRTLFLHGGLSGSFSSVAEVNQTVTAQLKLIKASSEMARATGALPSTTSLFDMNGVDAEAIGADFAAAITDPVFAEDGPFWYRGNARCHPLIEEPDVSRKLAELGVDRVVVGHTPTATREIVQRFGGKVWVIDTGMLSAVYRGQARALELVKSPQGVMPRPLPEGKARITAIDELLSRRRDTEYELLKTGRIEEKEATFFVIADEKRVEIEFTQTRANNGRQEVAAYLLDRYLGLGLVHPVAQREYRGRRGIVSVKRATVPEAERDFAPRNDCYRQSPNGSPFDLVSAFDSLVGKRDRSALNLLYDKRTHETVLVDNGTGFASNSRLPKYAATPMLSTLLADKLVLLDEEVLVERLGELLKPAQIKGILKRRDKILEWGASKS